jgi:hypothetical protein
MFAITPVKSLAQTLELKDTAVTATFGSQGLVSVRNAESNIRLDLRKDQGG